MTWRFRRSVRILPGVRLNFGKRGTSVSIGGHGMTTTYGPNGVYQTLSIPGTGVSYRRRIDGGQGARSAARAQAGQSGPYTVQLQPDGSIAYVDSAGLPASPAAARELKRQGRATLLPWLEQTAAAFNAQVQPLLTVHHTTPPPMDVVHYTPPSFPTPAPQPPVFQEVPPVGEPLLEDANWLEERIPFLRRRVEERNVRLLAEHQDRRRAWAEQDRQAQEEYARAELRWEADMEAWESALAAFDAGQMDLQRMLTEPEAGDEPHLAEYLRQRIAAVVTLRPTVTTIIVAALGRTVTLEVAIPHYEDPAAPWPATYAAVNAERLRLYYKNKLKRDVKAEHLTHIHSVALRLVGEVYAAYPAAETVLLQVRSLPLLAGAAEKRELRLRVGRAQWAALDFANLRAADVVSVLGPFRA